LDLNVTIPDPEDSVDGDNRKHVYKAKSAEHMRIVDLKRGSSNRSSSSKGSHDRIMDVYELPNKKEVSFSLDEEQENTLSMTFPTPVTAVMLTNLMLIHKSSRVLCCGLPRSSAAIVNL
jgi:hypothetical protein